VTSSDDQSIVLDVRPFHERGEEPFDAIMGAVAGLPPDRSLLLINSFEPIPLFRVMDSRGFEHTCTQVGPEEYHVRFTRKDDVRS
jgi:uncharacterized protein (DUF2249 family)